MLVGRRFRLELTPEQQALSEAIGVCCRVVWNLGLEQRRAAWDFQHQDLGYSGQCADLPDLKRQEPWLAAAPSHTLQQTLRDLDRACRRHGPRRVRFRSKRRWRPSFRFPDPTQIRVRQLKLRWGEVVLPKLGACRFRWSRAVVPSGGHLKHATVQYDGAHWFVSFCIENGRAEPPSNGLPAVGIDRGVVVAVATSDGDLFDRPVWRPAERRRLLKLQRTLARQKRGSGRWRATVQAIGRLHRRASQRRQDFVQQTAHRLASTHGLLVLEDLRVQSMTRSARGTVDKPGRRVAQKAGLNAAILAKGWGLFRRACQSQARDHGSLVLVVPPYNTSIRCRMCGYTAAENRESQAVFCCQACGHREHADLHASKVILAAGLAVTGRGGVATGQPVKRQPFPQGLPSAA